MSEARFVSESKPLAPSLSTQRLALSTQHSRLSTQHSALSTSGSGCSVSSAFGFGVRLGFCLARLTRCLSARQPKANVLASRSSTSRQIAFAGEGLIQRPMPLTAWTADVDLLVIRNKLWIRLR